MYDYGYYDYSSLYGCLFWTVGWAIVGAIVTPMIYKNKGRSQQTGMWVGALAGLIGGIIALVPLWLLVPRLQKCPNCGEGNDNSARVCKRCATPLAMGYSGAPMGFQPNQPNQPMQSQVPYQPPPATYQAPWRQNAPVQQNNIPARPAQPAQPVQTASPHFQPQKGGIDDLFAALDKPQASQSNIFISYRRADSADVTGRIYDRLVQNFGAKPIFKDIESIPFGVDFRTYLRDTVQQCRVLLAIIGPQWLAMKDEATGIRRLDDPADYVRIEIESALQRGIPVVPMLVKGATLPRPEDLPASLQELAFRNGTNVRSDPDFHPDMDRLIKGLDEWLK